jgi:hypothetical protein
MNAELSTDDVGLAALCALLDDGIRKLEAGLGFGMTPGELIADALAGSNTFRRHRRSRQAQGHERGA